jgi:hypothetical protein
LGWRGGKVRSELLKHYEVFNIVPDGTKDEVAGPGPWPAFKSASWSKPKMPCTDGARRAPSQRLVEDKPVVRVDAVHLEDVFGKIYADCGNLHVDGPLIGIRV